MDESKITISAFSIAFLDGAPDTLRVNVVFNERTGDRQPGGQVNVFVAASDSIKEVCESAIAEARRLMLAIGKPSS